jgi:magnesium chelatase family protein
MFARVTTVAFEGIEARPIDVRVQIGPGMPHFTIVGLPERPWPRAARGCAAR